MKAQALQKIQAIFGQFQNYHGKEGAARLEEEALSICNKFAVELPQPQTSFLKGLNCDRRGDIDEALEHYTLCAATCTEKDKVLKLQVMSLMGSIHADTENYNDAYQLYKQVLNNINHLDDDYLPLVYINISDLFLSLKQYQTAFELASLGKVGAKKLGNKGNHSLSLLNMGYAIGHMHQSAKAIDYIEEAISIAHEAGITRTEAIGYGYIAQIMVLDTGYHLDEVLQNFEMANTLFEQLHDQHNQCENLVFYAAYLEKNNFDTQAQSICSQASTMINSEQNYSFFSLLYKTLIRLEKKRGQSTKLLSLQDAYIHATEIALAKTQTSEYEVILQQVQETTAEQERQLLAKMKEHIAAITLIGQNIAIADDISQELPFIFDKIGTIFPTNEFGIALYDQDTEVLDYCYFYDINGPVERMQINCASDYSIGSYVVKNKATVHLNQISDEALDQFVPRKYRKQIDHVVYGNDPVQSIMLSPIMLGERVLGVLSTQHYLTNQYQQHHCGLFEQLASFIAVSLENRSQKQSLQQANKKLEVLSRTEPLTGLYNRFQLDEIAPQLMQQAKKNQHNLGVVIIDVDYFKNYNDLFGHYDGDKALKAVARQMTVVFDTPHDHLFRYGGDEFLILCENQTSVDLERKMQRLLQATKSLAIKSPVPELGSYLTLSIGAVNQVPGDEINTSFNTYFEQADKALYEVKLNGRNQCRLVELKTNNLPYI